jgi:hypothetical protein
MALTVKINNDGQSIPMGDTQGIMIPQDLPLVKVALAATSANKITICNLGDIIQSQPFIEKSGNNLIIKEAGIYLIDFGTVLRSSSSQQWYYIQKNSFDIKQGYYSSGDGSGEDTPIGFAEFDVGDILTFAMYTGSITGSDANNPAKICQLKRNAPYIIANKGALISGGAFIFDEDGHGYTENYSLEGVRCGTWIDGKPLYKKTYTFTGPGPNTILRIPHGLTGVKFRDIRGAIYGDSFDRIYQLGLYSGASGSMLVLSINGPNIELQQGGSESWTSWTAAVTLYYIKTTD